MLADGPSAYFRLGERDGGVVADSGVAAADAALSADAVLGRPGALLTDPGTGVATPGSYQSILASPSTLPTGNAARTASVWVNTSTATSSTAVVGWGDPANGGEEFAVGVRAAGITLDQGYGRVTVFRTDHPVTDGQWHQVALSYDGTTVRAYLDGRAQGSATPDGGLATVGSQLSLGVDALQFGYYVGDLQDLAVFPSALSADRIAAEYALSGYARPQPVAVAHAAAAGPNRAQITWGDNSDPDQPTSAYILRVVSGRDTGRTVSIAGDATGAAVAGLAAGDASFSIVAINQAGTGAAAVTNHVVVGGSTATYDATVLAAGPSAFYRLADAAGTPMTDSSAHAVDGTYAVGAQQGQDGPLAGDTGTSPDPSGRGIGVAPTDVPLYDSARTVEAWYRSAAGADVSLYPDGTVETLVSWGGGDVDAAFAVGVDNTSVVVDAGADRVGFPTSSTLHDGAWHQVVVTYGSAAVRAYADGRPLGSERFDGPLDTTPAPTDGDGGLFLGALAPGISSALGPDYGALADVSVLPTALTASDVATHYAASGLSTPAAPSGVGAVAGVNRATVSWTPPAAASRPIVEYRVTALAGTKVAASESVAPGAGSAVLTGLPAAGGYTFRVEARNASGWGVPSTSAAVTVTGSSTTYASTVQSAQPVAYYRLGDAGRTLTDSSGATHDGSYNPYDNAVHASVGAPVGDVDGSAAVTGQNPYAGATAVAGVPLPAQNDPRTAMVWINDPSLGDAPATVLSWGSDSPGQQFSVVATRASLGVSVDGSTRWAATPSLADGGWHLLAVTYDGLTWTSFVDGRQVGSGGFGDTIATDPDGPLTLGGYVDGSNGPVGARLDELAVFDRALGAGEVAGIFTASGYGRPAVPTAVTAAAGTNTATVSWTAPASPGTLLTDYVVTAVTGGRAVNSTVVKGAAKSAVVGGLAGGTSYSFTVAARNAYGAGPAGTSSAVTVTGTAVPYSAAVLVDNPVAYFRLADSAGTTVSESAGHQVTATQILNGSTGGTTTGPVRNDPSTGLVVSNEDAIARPVISLPLNDTARTVEAWVRLPSGSTTSGTVVGWGRSANGTAFGVTVAPGSVGVTIGGATRTFTTPFPLADGHWHMLDVSYGSAGAAGWVDAAALGTATFKKALQTQSSALGLGSSALGYDGPGQGFGLAQVSVYGTTLTSARVAAHFAAAGAARPPAPTAVAAQPGVNRATVTWTAPPTGGEKISAFQVSSSVAGGGGPAVTVGPTVTTVVVGGLQAGAVSFRVRALNAYGWGDWSAPTAGAAVSGTTTTYASAVLAMGPTAYLRLGDSASVAADSAGRASAASYAPGAVLGARGAVVGDPDKAVTSGGDAVASVRTALPTGDSPRTATVWFRAAQPDETRHAVLAWGSAGTARSVQLDVDPTGIGVEIGGEQYFAPAGTPEDGAWHLLALSTSGRTFTLYLDGSPVRSATFLNRLDTAPSNLLQVGGDVSGDNGPSGSTLDEVAVFPAALSGATIAQLFAAGGYAPAGAPGAPAATAGTNQATITWTAAPSPGTDVASYRVVAYAGNSVAGVVSVPGTATSAVLSGLPGGTAYTFAVTARNAYGSGPQVVSAAVTPGGSATTYASSVAALGPSAYYRLGDGGDLVDWLGGPDGRYLPSAVRRQKGALTSDPDKSVSISGQAAATASPVLPTGAQARAVVVWVRTSSSGTQYLASWGAQAAHQEFSVVVDSGTVLLEVNDQELAFPTSTSPTDGTWHQVAVSTDGRQASAWLDGASLGSLNFSSPLATAAGPIEIGSALWGSGGVDGSIDEFAVFPHTLTTAQVRALFTTAHA
ncbi:LamG-like jellyroll fold domain-containing protein [Jatrophihabitans sp. YIM 134969]